MSRTDHQSANSCPECNGRLSLERGETICDECGLVVDEDRIDLGPEWRSFEQPDRNRRRTGAPLTRSRHDRGLSTEIGYGYGASSRLTGRKRRRFARLRRQHSRARMKSKIDRNRVYAFSEIRRLTAVFDLPSTIRDRACVLFESAQNEGLLRGRSIEGFAAAAVYATCRVEGISRTRGEIVERSRASESELKAAYDAINRDLGLPVGPIDPREYVPRFASELDLPAAVERRATELATEATSMGLSNGRNPSGVAAGCLYTAAIEQECDLTQRDAAVVADVAPVTVRSTYQALRS